MYKKKSKVDNFGVSKRFGSINGSDMQATDAFTAVNNVYGKHEKRFWANAGWTFLDNLKRCSCFL